MARTQRISLKLKPAAVAMPALVYPSESLAVGLRIPLRWDLNIELSQDNDISIQLRTYLLGSFEDLHHVIARAVEEDPEGSPERHGAGAGQAGPDHDEAVVVFLLPGRVVGHEDAAESHRENLGRVRIASHVIMNCLVGCCCCWMLGALSRSVYSLPPFVRSRGRQDRRRPRQS